MTADPPTFDLIHDPWIPCRERDGTAAEHGILRTLGRAHELAGLSGDVPTQTFALTRLLLAALHGALAGPENLRAWEALWRADELPVARIAAYLAAHRGRFDLFHPATPFLQVADLRTAKGDTSELSKLIADVPNGVPFFTTRAGGDLSLTFAEAARWLVHCHAFDPSGIKSGAVGDPRVKGGRGYPIGVAWSGLLGGLLLEGESLKDTLLLNLVARDFDDYARDPRVDRPVWEREPVTAAEELPGGRAPTGPVDLYVWQSRRIRLVPADGRVTRVLVANGEQLTPQNMQHHEPHTAWRRSEAQQRKAGGGIVYMPREHDPDRAIWRGLASLLPGTSTRQTAEAGRWLAPGIVEWLSYLGVDRILPRGFRSDIVDDTLALNAILARRDAVELAQVAVAAVEAADAAARAAGGLAGDLAAAAGGPPEGPRSRTTEQVYALLDPAFRQWLLSVDGAADDADLTTVWQQTAARVVRSVADELLENRLPGSSPPARG